MTDREELRERLAAVEPKFDTHNSDEYELDEEDKEDIRKMIEDARARLTAEERARLDELKEQIAAEETTTEGHELTPTEKEYHALLFSGGPDT